MLVIHKMDYKKIVLGFLLFMIASSIIYVQLSNDVKFRLDEDKTTLYLKDLNDAGEPVGRWKVAAREYSKIMDGASNTNRDAKNIYLETAYKDEAGKLTILRDEQEVTNSEWLSEYSDLKPSQFMAKRYTPYIRGHTVIDTYTFDGTLKDITLVPLSHTIQVLNGKDLFLRYYIDDIYAPEEKRKLTGETDVTFNRLKVEFENGYNWAWIGYPYGSDSFAVQYKVQSNDETYSLRLFDPPKQVPYDTGSNFLIGPDEVFTTYNGAVVGSDCYYNDNCYDYSDSATAYTTTTNTPHPHTNSITTSFWVKSPSMGAAVIPVSCGITFAGGASTGFEFRQYDSYWRLNVRNGTLGSSVSTDTFNTTDNEWHYIVGVIDREDNLTKIYFDGELQDTDSSNFGDSEILCGTGLSVGARLGGSFGLTGTIDQPLVINSSLTDEQIKSLYKIGLTKLKLMPGVNVEEYTGYWKLSKDNAVKDNVDLDRPLDFVTDTWQVTGGNTFITDDNTFGTTDGTGVIFKGGVWEEDMIGRTTRFLIDFTSTSHSSLLFRTSGSGVLFDGSLSNTYSEGSHIINITVNDVVAGSANLVMQPTGGAENYTFTVKKIVDYTEVNFTDLSGNSNNAEIYNPPATFVEDENKITNGAFSASTNYIKTPSINYSDELFTSTWVKSTSNIPVTQKYVFDQGYTSGVILYSDGNKFKYLAKIGGTTYNAQFGDYIVKDKWYNIVYNYDGSQFEVWTNGVKTLNFSASGTIGPTVKPAVHIGSRSFTDNIWQGYISEFKIDDESKTDAQIIADYKVGQTRLKLYNSPRENEYDAYWELSQSNLNSTSTGFTDLSGNDITADITFTPAVFEENQEGKSNKSMTFINANDYLTLQNTGLPTTFPISVLFWAKSDTANGVILNYDNDVNFTINFRASNGVLGIQNPNSGLYKRIQLSTYDESIWNHYGVVINNDGSIENISLNGVQQPDYATSNWNWLGGGTWIGNRPASAQPFVGAISELKIVGKKLTQNEILADYKVGNNRLMIGVE